MARLVDAVVEDMPDFSPSEEDLAFKGDPNDRRAVMAHRRKSTQLQVGVHLIAEISQSSGFTCL